MPLCVGTLISLHAITDGKRFLGFLSTLPLPALLHSATTTTSTTSTTTTSTTSTTTTSTTTTSTTTAPSRTAAFFAHFQGNMVALGFDGWASSWLLGWARSFEVVVGYFEVARNTSQLGGLFLKWVTNFLVDWLLAWSATYIFENMPCKRIAIVLHREGIKSDCIDISFVFKGSLGLMMHLAPAHPTVL